MPAIGRQGGLDGLDDDEDGREHEVSENALVMNSRTCSLERQH